MRQTFARLDIKGVLLVDADSIPSIGRWLFITLVIVCPSLSQILQNTYSAPIRCVIQGSREIALSEGTTQEDPLLWECMPLLSNP